MHVSEERAKLFELRITLQKLAENTIKKIRRDWNSASENSNVVSIFKLFHIIILFQHYDFGFIDSPCRADWPHYFQCFGKTFEKV